MVTKAHFGMILTLFLATGAKGAVTWQFASPPHQSGTPAPVGFDISSAVYYSSGTPYGSFAVVFDEPASHQTWVGYRADAGSTNSQVDYSFDITGHNIDFSPSISKIGDVGGAAITTFYLWEPLPLDLEPGNYLVSPQLLQLGSGSLLDGTFHIDPAPGTYFYYPGPAASSAPEPASLWLLGGSLFIIVGRKRPRLYGNAATAQK